MPATVSLEILWLTKVYVAYLDKRIFLLLKQMFRIRSARSASQLSELFIISKYIIEIRFSHCIATMITAGQRGARQGMQGERRPVAGLVARGGVARLHIVR